jgi:NADH:ubiquinone oxidoreductase subunit 3 (subunit A)
MLRIGLSFLIIGAAYLLSMKTNLDAEKRRPFECGFLAHENRRSPFSIQFFLIRLIFLVFDIELILLFPFVTGLNDMFLLLSFNKLIFFLLFLSFGLIYE